MLSIKCSGHFKRKLATKCAKNNNIVKQSIKIINQYIIKSFAKYKQTIRFNWWLPNIPPVRQIFSIHMHRFLFCSDKSALQWTVFVRDTNGAYFTMNYNPIIIDVWLLNRKMANICSNQTTNIQIKLKVLCIIKI